MLFNSWTFLLFFPTVYALYRLIDGWAAKKFLLLVASYMFYGWWNPPFALLLLLTTAVDYHLARRIAASRTPGARRAYLLLSLCSNLSVLGFFKYADFLAANGSQLLHALGLAATPAHHPLQIILPVGISFYTLQALSYTIDVYRGQLQPAKTFRDFAFYVSFFPQLVAGPIIRARDFLWQCEQPPAIRPAQISWGACLIAWGLFKKVVLADAVVAPLVNPLFLEPNRCGTLEAWAAAYGFAAQIYCDFSGYSDIAIGLALMLGFHVLDNFNRPYGALSFGDFWSRWHISLSTWLRDYLYVPLGGNRRGLLMTCRNLLLTMLIGGLWHGASWTFVAWGGLHGLFLVGERLVFRRLGTDRSALERLPRPAKLLLWALVFHLVCLSWVLFRSASMADARHLLATMFGLGPAPLITGAVNLRLPIVLVATGGLVGWHFINRHRTLTELARNRPAWILGLAAGLLLFACRVFGAGGHAFIYFQF